MLAVWYIQCNVCGRTNKKKVVAFGEPKRLAKGICDGCLSIMYKSYDGGDCEKTQK